MKVSYDQKTDILSLVLKINAHAVESDEDKPGVILDYDAAGDLIAIEILDASKRVSNADRVEFNVTL